MPTTLEISDLDLSNIFPLDKACPHKVKLEQTDIIACYKDGQGISASIWSIISKGRSLSIHLLSTKFNIPSTVTKVVRRLRLLRLLDEGLEKSASLILVCGPAGYGKTTIVSEWLQVSNIFRHDQVAWLT